MNFLYFQRKRIDEIVSKLDDSTSLQNEHIYKISTDKKASTYQKLSNSLNQNKLSENSNETPHKTDDYQDVVSSSAFTPIISNNLASSSLQSKEIQLNKVSISSSSSSSSSPIVSNRKSSNNQKVSSLIQNENREQNNLKNSNRNNINKNNDSSYDEDFESSIKS